MKKFVVLKFVMAFFVLSAFRPLFVFGGYVENSPAQNAFPIVHGGGASTIVIDANDFPGVIRATKDLADDVRKVSGLCDNRARKWTPVANWQLAGIFVTNTISY